MLTETTTTTTPASVPTETTLTLTAPRPRLSEDERAKVREALQHIRCARCTADDESISMTWDTRDDIVQDLTQAVELLRRLVL